MDKKRIGKRGFTELKSEWSEKFRRYLRGYAAAPGDTEEEHKQAVRAKALGLLRGVASGLFGMLLTRAELPFGAAPFGTALFGAAGAGAPYVYVGLCVSSVFSPSPLANFLTYSIGMVFRCFLAVHRRDGGRHAFFCEGMGMRVLCGVTMAFSIGVYRTVLGGFLYYDLFGCLIGLVSVPAAVVIFRVAFDRAGGASGLRDACIAAVTAVGVWSLAGLTFAGFSLASVAAFIITLYVSRECGMLRGGMIGLLCGLGAGVSLAPLFAIAGLLAGLFWRVSTVAATVAALGAGTLYSVWTGGSISLLSTAPDLLCASVIFAPLAHFGLIPPLPIYGRTSHIGTKTLSAEAEKMSRHGTEERFEAMKDAFGSLAEVFRRMSDRVGRPGSAEIHESCRRVFDGYCNNCARHSLCWDQNYTDTCDAIDLVARKIRDEGRVLLSDIPDHTLRRCFRAENIVRDVNADYSARIERAIKENKSGVFADDYEAISRLIGEALRANEEEYKPDERLSRKLASCAGYLDLPITGISCYGVRKKTIVAGGVDVSRVRAGAEDIRRSFEKVCGFPLDVPEFSIARSGVSMTVTAARRFRAVCAHAGSAREGESMNGDSVTFFENRRDYFYALLSDGMGSGSEAALTSRLCGVFLEKMLRAGNSKQSALDMLNGVVRGKGLECFATVDLFELDLLSGDACFVKSGAAPSYVVRGDSVFRIESGTYPIGIVGEASSEQISMKLEKNDTVVLLSDGVAGCFDEALWVVDMLACGRGRNDSPEQICRRIIDGARSRGRGDDASCAVIKIENA